jgi:hypothetical protein
MPHEAPPRLGQVAGRSPARQTATMPPAGQRLDSRIIGVELPPAVGLDKLASKDDLIASPVRRPEPARTGRGPSPARCRNSTLLNDPLCAAVAPCSRSFRYGVLCPGRRATIVPCCAAEGMVGFRPPGGPANREG